MSETKKVIAVIKNKVLSVKMEGNLSREELDRIYRMSVRELQKHKRELVRQLEANKPKEETTNE